MVKHQVTEVFLNTLLNISILFAVIFLSPSYNWDTKLKWAVPKIRSRLLLQSIDLPYYVIVYTYSSPNHYFHISSYILKGFFLFCFALFLFLVRVGYENVSINKCVWQSSWNILKICGKSSYLQVSINTWVSRHLSVLKFLIS